MEQLLQQEHYAVQPLSPLTVCFQHRSQYRQKAKLTQPLNQEVTLRGEPSRQPHHQQLRRELETQAKKRTGRRIQPLPEEKGRSMTSHRPQKLPMVCQLKRR